uniref:Uncharacterized protein n=1 Tax=Salix viminalis TaxID=40686 RepID=A0A6N2KHM5_SALVM
MLTAGDANSDLCLYWFGTWQSLDIQLENLSCRVNMILLRVNKARVQTVGKDIMHFFRVIWVQFIQPLLSLLGILIRLLQQIQPTEQNSMQILFATRAIITLSVWDVQSCGTLFGQCLT